ncbi:MAG: rod shape-determining protein RodA [Lachnospiraceae bacterium]|nr:rod shape-determining protein RodA [Lachnospiraceae bacterium]
MIRKYRLKDYNYRLVIYLAALGMLGVLLVGSAWQPYERRQLLGFVGGMIVMFIVSMIDYSWVLQFHWLMYAGNLALLLLVFAIGKNTNGATRWIEIGSFKFQPVELAKIILILFFARYFMNEENRLSSFRTIVQSVILITAPLVLIFLQPDLKNTLTVLALFAVMYFAAGLSYRAIGLILLVTVPIAAVAIGIILQPDSGILQDYQYERIMTHLQPDNDEYSGKAMQQKNSVIAIGSGGLTGKGLGNKEEITANNGDFVAESETDFIFSVAGEELGFVGSCGIILLLLLVVFECLYMSARAKDLAGRVICSGMACIVSLQSFINIGVSCGLLPNTGTPLPFVSHGLTSMLCLFIGMGFVLNVGLQARIRMEREDKA